MKYPKLAICGYICARLSETCPAGARYSVKKLRLLALGNGHPKSNDFINYRFIIYNSLSIPLLSNYLRGEPCEIRGRFDALCNKEAPELDEFSGTSITALGSGCAIGAAANCSHHSIALAVNLMWVSKS